jgi:arginine/ornithine transport system substrate-binding protein
MAAMRRSLCCAAALCAAAGLGAPPARALDVCVEGAYPPFSEVTPDGTIRGFDIDIANALCGALDEACAFKLTRWDRMIPALTGDVCDAIVASMSDTDARRARIDFTDRYYRSPVRFVAADGAAAPQTLAEAGAMAGKVVGVQRGTVNETYMEAHYPSAELRLYGNQEHVLIDLTLGRLDAVLGEALQLETGFLDTPAGEGFVFYGQPQYDPAILGRGAAIGVRKDDPGLRDRLNAGIAAIRADGTYAAIAARYFDTDIYGE